MEFISINWEPPLISQVDLLIMSEILGLLRHPRSDIVPDIRSFHMSMSS
jgi:hypothetical protein